MMRLAHYPPKPHGQMWTRFLLPANYKPFKHGDPGKIRTCDTRIRNQQPPLIDICIPLISFTLPREQISEFQQKQSVYPLTNLIFSHKSPHNIFSLSILSTCKYLQICNLLAFIQNQLQPQNYWLIKAQKTASDSALGKYPKASKYNWRLTIFRVLGFCRDTENSQRQLFVIYFLTIIQTYYSNYLRIHCILLLILEGVMKVETKKVSFDCPVDVLERLDRLAKKGDRPRSKLIANLVEAGVETIEDCEKVGLLQLTLIIRDMKNSMSDWAKKMRERKDFDGLL